MQTIPVAEIRRRVRLVRMPEMENALTYGNEVDRVGKDAYSICYGCMHFFKA